MAEFSKRGLTCKLISTGKRTEDGFSAFVQPTLCKAEDLEAHIPMNFNLITFEGAAAGRQSLYGQGAGRYPTAYNVVQDLCDLLHGNGFYTTCEGFVQASNIEAMCFYVRGGEDQWLQANTQEVWGEGVVTKPVSVRAMHMWLKNHPDAFMAAIR